MGKGDKGGGIPRGTGDGDDREPTTDELISDLISHGNTLEAIFLEEQRKKEELQELRSYRAKVNQNYFNILHELADAESITAWLQDGEVSERYERILTRYFGSEEFDSQLLHTVLCALCKSEFNNGALVTVQNIKAILQDMRDMRVIPVQTETADLPKVAAPIATFIDCANNQPPKCGDCAGYNHQIRMRYAGNSTTAVCEDCGSARFKNETGEWVGPETTNP